MLLLLSLGLFRYAWLSGLLGRGISGGFTYGALAGFQNILLKCEFLRLGHAGSFLRGLSAFLRLVFLGGEGSRARASILAHHACVAQLRVLARPEHELTDLG